MGEEGLPLVLEEAAGDGLSQDLGCSVSLKTPGVSAGPGDQASPPSSAKGLEQGPQALWALPSTISSTLGGAGVDLR